MVSLRREQWTVAGITMLAICIVGGIVLWKGLPSPVPRSMPAAGSSTQSASAALGSIPVDVVGATKARLRAVAGQLRGVTDPAEARRQFDSLRGHLSTIPGPAAAQIIRQFLQSKADAPSSLGFELGANGALSAWPTLRVFLLDYLGQIDARAASASAEETLASMDSPDEWAVSLRNYARANDSLAAREYLQGRLAEMLQHEPWIKNPSAGFLESFDVAVHLGGTALLPVLTDLLRQQDNRPVAHAAFLALDRLTLLDAAAVLAVLQQQRELMQGREATRANYFARADVRDARQREILERYLLDPQLEAQELEVFSGVYPSANFMISHNLLTATTTPDGMTLRARDREALTTVEIWLGDPRFEKVRPQLSKIRTRLQEFTRSAAR